VPATVGRKIPLIVRRRVGLRDVRHAIRQPWQDPLTQNGEDGADEEDQGEDDDGCERRTVGDRRDHYLSMLIDSVSRTTHGFDNLDSTRIKSYT
jgi:hypothetical protein